MKDKTGWIKIFGITALTVIFVSGGFYFSTCLRLSSVEACVPIVSQHSIDIRLLKQNNEYINKDIGEIKDNVKTLVEIAMRGQKI